MRLRRFEFIFIGITLAFVCFMGGFFSGRNVSSVSIAEITTQNGDSASITITTEARQVADASSVSQQRSDSPEPAATQDTTVAVQIDIVEQPIITDSRVNINTASHSQLTSLPGIGSVLAERIIDYRVRNGNFSRIEELRNVSGIGERRFEAIADLITVGS